MNKYLRLLGARLLCIAAFVAPSFANSQNMGLEWAKNIANGNAVAIVNDMAVDTNGNVFLTGAFFAFSEEATLDVDPGPQVFELTANGITEIFIVKLDAAGNFVWARQVGSPATGFWNSAEWGASIALDTEGNVLVGGRFVDTADFDPGPGVATLIAKGFEDGFILKLDASGNYVWAVSMGSEHQSEGVCEIITDESGNVFATGPFNGEVDFDPGSGTALLSSAPDIFVLKLDAAGAFQWVSPLYASGICNATGLARDSWGNVYVSGYLTVNAPPGAAWGGQGSTVGIWKLNEMGNMSWAYQCDDVNDPSDEGGSIVCDAAGNVYVTGTYNGVIDFDPGPGLDTLMTDLTSTASDIFLLKLDSTSEVQWAKPLRTGGNYGGEDTRPNVILDAAGNIFISSNFLGTVDFDPGPGTATLTADLGSGGVPDMFLLKMDTSGAYLWAKSIGSEAGFENPASMVGDARGNLWCTGQFENTVDFDPGPDVFNLSPSGPFVFKLVCNDTTSILLTDTVCDSYTLNGETYTESGSYTQIRPNAAGCDSIITLQLTISEPDPIIAVEEFILSTTIPYTTYQWLLNDVVIVGATQATYAVLQNGAYTVAVTNTHGCADTSAIYIVDNVGIEDAHVLANQVNIYPNPAADLVFIQSPVAVDVTLSSVDGHVIRTVEDARSMSVSDLAAGVYLLRITDKDGMLIKAEKLIKQEP